MSGAGPPFRLNAGGENRLVRLVDGPGATLFVHDPSRCQMSRQLMKFHSFDSYIIKNVLRAHVAVCGGRELLLDIGANLGVVAASAAELNVSTLAFEPLSYNTELLAATAARAGTTEHLALFKLALSDKAGELCIQPAYAHSPERNWGNGQLVPLERCLRRNNTSPSERIRISTLDHVLERLDLSAAPVGTIKVDVCALAAPLTTPALCAR